MTGFGRAETKTERFELIAEARSLNNRYLEINLRLPKSLSSYEYELKEVVKNFVFRGKVSVNITFRDLLSLTANFNLKKESVRYYQTILQEIRQEAGLKDPVKLEHLLHFSELLEPEESELKDDVLETELKKVLSDALKDMNRMRMLEGQNMVQDITARIMEIGKNVSEIEKKGRENPKRDLEKLTARIRDLVDSGEIDRSRLELELALISDRVDISEECTRMESHLKLFREVLDGTGEMGKKLTFILQEMQRESNTIGSKTTDISIAHQIIQIKEEIEKVREQVQNLE